MSVVLGYQMCGNFLWLPQETDTATHPDDEAMRHREECNYSKEHTHWKWIVKWLASKLNIGCRARLHIKVQTSVWHPPHLRGRTEEEAFIQHGPRGRHCASARPLHYLGDDMTNHPYSPAHICQHCRERLLHQLEPWSEEDRHVVRIQWDWGQNHRVSAIIYHTSTT